MPIQHRDLPNSELHEVKGASTASAGSVLVSNGVGGTTFSKLGVANFTGSVPDSVPDLVLSTNGSGGFKVRQQAIGQLRAYRYGSATSPGNVEILSDVAPTGMYLADGGFKVGQSGFYLILFHDYVKVPATNPELAPENHTPAIVNQFTNPVFTGLSGAVYLNADDTYYLGNSVIVGVNFRFSVVRYDL